MNMLKKNWVRNSGDGVQELMEVIFIQEYKNNPKEMKLFCMIYLAGEDYGIVADDIKKQCNFSQSEDILKIQNTITNNKIMNNDVTSLRETNQSTRLYLHNNWNFEVFQMSILRATKTNF